MPTTTAAQQLLMAVPAEASAFPEEYWELMARYRGELLNQAYAIVGDIQEAEDCVQVTFCDAFRDRARMAQVASLGGWLRAVNRANACRRAKRMRRNAEKVVRKKREMPARTDTTGGFTLLELREVMAQAVERLPEQHRSVVVMRYWEGLAHDEIAARLKLPASSVRRLFHEATVKLYERLRPVLDPASPPKENAE